MSILSQKNHARDTNDVHQTCYDTSTFRRKDFFTGDAMQFNPFTNTLLTDDGELIKKLNCPYAVQWEDCTESKDQQEQVKQRNRICQQCQTPILDTRYYSEQELVQKSRSQQTLCLKIDVHQPNISINSQGTIISQ